MASRLTPEQPTDTTERRADGRYATTMPIARDTFVVVPCYNEAARLAPDAFLDALETHPGLRFVFVNDGSQDSTAAVLDDLAAQAPERVFALHLERNAGKAEAVRRGMLFAFERGARVAGYWDADLATPLWSIEILADALQTPPRDIVLGSRVLLLGSVIERSLSRHLIGRVFATVASNALSLRIYDTQCGAKLMRHTPEVAAAFQEPFSLDWSFDVELLGRLSALYGQRFFERCVEIPLPEWRDAKGSKITVRQFPKIATEMLRMRWVVARQQKGIRATDS